MKPVTPRLRLPDTMRGCRDRIEQLEAVLRKIASGWSNNEMELQGLARDVLDIPTPLQRLSEPK